MTAYTTAIAGMVVVGVVLTVAVVYALMRPTALPMLKRDED